MAFVLKQQKSTSKWFEHESGAKLKVRNINHKAYQVAMEIAQQKYALQDDIKHVASDSLAKMEMLYTLAAFHLLEDWSNVEIQDGEDGEVQALEFSNENAFRLMYEGGASGADLWSFIIDKSVELQKEIDGNRDALLGKSNNSTSGADAPKKVTKSKA